MFHEKEGKGVLAKMLFCLKRGRVQKPPKKDNIIIEQPLTVYFLGIEFMPYCILYKIIPTHYTSVFQCSVSEGYYVFCPCITGYCISEMQFIVVLHYSVLYQCITAVTCLLT